MLDVALLHASCAAMPLIVVLPFSISESHFRPCAIALTSSTRLGAGSEDCGWELSGTMTSWRRRWVVLLHGTMRTDVVVSSLEAHLRLAA